jgi:DNA-damage-inducible protein J
MTKSNLTISVDAGLKRDFMEFCEDMGLTVTAALNLFMKKTVREQRIPFSIQGDIPTAETLRAMKEAEDIIMHPGRYERFSSAEELLEALR